MITSLHIQQGSSISFIGETSGDFCVISIYSDDKDTYVEQITISP